MFEKEKQALKDTIKIWEYLAKTGDEDKPDFASEFLNECPLCDYAKYSDRSAKFTAKHGNCNCNWCLVKWPQYYCDYCGDYLNFCQKSYYGEWEDTHSKKHRKELAKKIVELAKAKLKEYESK